MTFEEAMKEVESPTFDASVNVASDLRTFLLGVQQQEAVHILFRELDSPEKRLQLFSQVVALSRQQIDPRYENLWDTALAVYVWLISLKDANLAKVASQTAMQAPQCWWAAKVSSIVSTESRVNSDAELMQREFTATQAVKINRATTIGETSLPAAFLSETSDKITATEFQTQNTEIGSITIAA